jgi:hypothetical protein
VPAGVPVVVVIVIVEDIVKLAVIMTDPWPVLVAPLSVMVVIP